MGACETVVNHETRLRSSLKSAGIRIMASETRTDDSANVAILLERIDQLLHALQNSSAQPISEWLTVAEVAAELRVSRDTVERLIATRKIRFTEIVTGEGVGLRHRYRIRREWVANFLLKTAVDPQTNPAPTRIKRRNNSVDFIGD